MVDYTCCPSYEVFYMSKPLAVFVRRIGIISETFIQKHIEKLMPDGTVVVALDDNTSLGRGHWQVDLPTLLLSHVQVRMTRHVVHRVLQPLGISSQVTNIERLKTEAIRQFLQQHDVQVILAEYLDLFIQWIPLAQELGIRFFAHAHGYDVSKRLRDPHWQQAYLRYNQADGVVTMSQASRVKLIALGLDPAKIHVIPYGIAVPSQPPSRFPQQIVRCLAVGRMVVKKSPIRLLDAFRRASALWPHLRLDYVGSGALLPAAKEFVEVMGLTEQVTLHGAQPNTLVQELLQAADLFIQHSAIDPETGDEEGLPVSILEAMAAGLPVVATIHAGIPEAVLDGKTGFLVAEGDTITMAEHIVTLAKDADLRGQFGLAGWQRARDCFTWEREKLSLQQVLGLSDQVCI